MKRHFLIACMLGGALCAAAQNGGATTDGVADASMAESVVADSVVAPAAPVATESFVNMNPYNRLSVSYADMMLSRGQEDSDLEGVSVSFVHGFSISKEKPWFFETGLDFSFLTCKEYMDESESAYAKASLISVAVPLNFSLRVLSGANNFSLQPFAGLNLRYNLSGKMKVHVNGMGSASVDMLDKDEVDTYGMSDYVWRKFQIGLNIGCGINYKRCWFALQVTPYFIGLWDGINSTTGKLTFGYYL